MKKIIFIITIIMCCSITSFAHEGSTDEYGGHYHEYNGISYYHYHHGFDAHQHPDGMCPYREGWINPYQDQYKSNAMKELLGTYSNSEALENGTAAKHPYEKTVTPAPPTPTPVPTDITTPNADTSSSTTNSLKKSSVLNLFITALLFFVFPIFFCLKSKNKHLSKKQIIIATIFNIVIINIIYALIFKTIFAVAPNFLWGTVTYFFINHQNKKNAGKKNNSLFIYNVLYITFLCYFVLYIPYFCLFSTCFSDGFTQKVSK